MRSVSFSLLLPFSIYSHNPNWQCQFQTVLFCQTFPVMPAVVALFDAIFFSFGFLFVLLYGPNQITANRTKSSRIELSWIESSLPSLILIGFVMNYYYDVFIFVHCRFLLWLHKFCCAVYVIVSLGWTELLSWSLMSVIMHNLRVIILMLRSWRLNPCILYFSMPFQTSFIIV